MNILNFIASAVNAQRCIAFLIVSFAKSLQFIVYLFILRTGISKFTAYILHQMFVFELFCLVLKNNMAVAVNYD